MNNLVVLDGDFEFQLRRYLSADEQLDPTSTLKVLKFNRYAVYKTHLDYLRAGAQIIRTNTRYMSTTSIEKYLKLHPDMFIPMINVAVRLARQAMFKYYEETGGDGSDVQMYNLHRPLLAGTCGSFHSSCFATFGTWVTCLTSNTLIEFYKMRVKAFIDAEVDILAFESVPTLIELEAIIIVLKKYPGCSVIITFLCLLEGSLIDGSTFLEAAINCTIALPDQIIAIGIECSVPGLAKDLLRDAKNNKDLKIPFVFYADRYFLSSTMESGKSIVVPHNFVQECLDNRICYIGGGFNTNAEDIKKISEQVKNYVFKTGTTINTCSYRNVKNRSKL